MGAHALPHGGAGGREETVRALATNDSRPCIELDAAQDIVVRCRLDATWDECMSLLQARSSGPGAPRVSPELASRLGCTAFRRGGELLAGFLRDGEVVGQDEAAALLLLGALSGEHVILLGPTGCGKQRLARALPKVLSAGQGDALVCELGPEFTLEDLLGPVSVAKQREGKARRHTVGRLPEASVACLAHLDEVPTDVSAALEPIVGEGCFANGTKVKRCRLTSLVATARGLPSDPDRAPLMDRILLRVWMDYVDEGEAFSSLVAGTGEIVEPPPAIAIEPGAVAEVRERVATVGFPSHVTRAVLGLHARLVEDGAGVSARRMAGAGRLLQAAAYCSGRSEVSLVDCALLPMVLAASREGQARAETLLYEEAGSPSMRELSLLEAAAGQAEGAEPYPASVLRDARALAADLATAAARMSPLVDTDEGRRHTLWLQRPGEVASKLLRGLSAAVERLGSVVRELEAHARAGGGAGGEEAGALEPGREGRGGIAAGPCLSRLQHRWQVRANAVGLEELRDDFLKEVQGATYLLGDGPAVGARPGGPSDRGRGDEGSCLLRAFEFLVRRLARGGLGSTAFGSQCAELMLDPPRDRGRLAGDAGRLAAGPSGAWAAVSAVVIRTQDDIVGALMETPEGRRALARSLLEQVGEHMDGVDDVTGCLVLAVLARVHAVVVGPTGSGKSTLARRLLRITRPENVGGAVDAPSTRRPPGAVAGFFESTVTAATTMADVIGPGGRHLPAARLALLEGVTRAEGAAARAIQAQLKTGCQGTVVATSAEDWRAAGPGDWFPLRAACPPAGPRAAASSLPGGGGGHGPAPRAHLPLSPAHQAALLASAEKGLELAGDVEDIIAEFEGWARGPVESGGLGSHIPVPGAWRDAVVRVLRVAAWCNGRQDTVHPVDCLLLRHCGWRGARGRKAAASWVLTRVAAGPAARHVAEAEAALDSAARRLPVPMRVTSAPGVDPTHALAAGPTASPRGPAGGDAGAPELLPVAGAPAAGEEAGTPRLNARGGAEEGRGQAPSPAARVPQGRPVASIAVSRALMRARTALEEAEAAIPAADERWGSASWREYAEAHVWLPAGGGEVEAGRAALGAVADRISAARSYLAALESEVDLTAPPAAQASGERGAAQMTPSPSLRDPSLTARVGSGELVPPRGVPRPPLPEDPPDSDACSPAEQPPGQPDPATAGEAPGVPAPPEGLWFSPGLLEHHNTFEVVDAHCIDIVRAGVLHEKRARGGAEAKEEGLGQSLKLWRPPDPCSVEEELGQVTALINRHVAAYAAGFRPQLTTGWALAKSRIFGGAASGSLSSSLSSRALRFHGTLSSKSLLASAVEDAMGRAGIGRTAMAGAEWGSYPRKHGKALDILIKALRCTAEGRRALTVSLLARAEATATAACRAAGERGEALAPEAASATAAALLAALAGEHLLVVGGEDVAGPLSAAVAAGLRESFRLDPLAIENRIPRNVVTRPRQRVRTSGCVRLFSHEITAGTTVAGLFRERGGDAAAQYGGGGDEHPMSGSNESPAAVARASALAAEAGNIVQAPPALHRCLVAHLSGDYTSAAPDVAAKMSSVLTRRMVKLPARRAHHAPLLAAVACAPASCGPRGASEAAAMASFSVRFHAEGGGAAVGATDDEQPDLEVSPFWGAPLDKPTSDAAPVAIPLSMDDVAHLRRVAGEARLGERVVNLISDLRRRAAEAGVPLSDLRVERAVPVLQMCAITCGRSEVSMADAWMLQYCLADEGALSPATINRWYHTNLAPIDFSSLVSTYADPAVRAVERHVEILEKTAGLRRRGNSERAAATPPIPQAASPTGRGGASPPGYRSASLDPGRVGEGEGSDVEGGTDGGGGETGGSASTDPGRVDEEEGSGAEGDAGGETGAAAGGRSGAETPSPAPEVPAAGPGPVSEGYEAPLGGGSPEGAGEDVGEGGDAQQLPTGGTATLATPPPPLEAAGPGRGPRPPPLEEAAGDVEPAGRGHVTGGGVGGMAAAAVRELRHLSAVAAERVGAARETMDRRTTLPGDLLEQLEGHTWVRREAFLASLHEAMAGPESSVRRLEARLAEALAAARGFVGAAA